MQKALIDALESNRAVRMDFARQTDGQIMFGVAGISSDGEPTECQTIIVPAENLEFALEQSLVKLWRDSHKADRQAAEKSAATKKTKKATPAPKAIEEASAEPAPVEPEPQEEPVAEAVPVSEPEPEAAPEAPRCHAVHKKTGKQCVLREGHDGNHQLEE